MSVNPYESPKETEHHGLSIEPITEVTDEPSTGYQIAGTLTLVMGIGLGTTVALFTIILWNTIEFKPLPPFAAIVICVIVGAVTAVCLHLTLLWIVRAVIGINKHSDLKAKASNNK